MECIDFKLSHFTPSSLALQNEVHDLRLNSSANVVSPHHKMYGDSYGAEGLQDTFNPVQSYHGAPLTGQLSTNIQAVSNSLATDTAAFFTSV